MTAIETVAQLHITNQNIAAALSRLGQRGDLSSRVHAGELLTLQQAIQRGACFLREIRGNDPVSETEIREFIGQLRTLEKALPFVLESLQIRKRQLQDALQHFEAASNWAHVSQCALPAPKFR